jgi:hypothetical protein
MMTRWLPGALAALAGPAGLLLGHKLKRRLWLRRWFLALIAFPLMAFVNFSPYRDNLILIAVALFTLGFYSGQWDVSLENPQLAALLGKRLLLWQIYGGLVAVCCIAATMAELLLWALWFSDRSTVSAKWMWAVNTFALVSLAGLVHYIVAKRRWARRVGVRSFPVRPDLPW